MSATVTKLNPQAVNHIASLDLPASVIHLAAFVSKDESRIALSHLRIEPVNAGKACAVATNGHLLAKVEFELAMGADYIKQPIHIPLATLKALKIGKHDTAHVEVVEGGRFPEYRITYSAGERSVTATDTGSFTFPQYEQVIPSVPVKNAVKRIGLDTQYLGDIGTYCKRCGLHTGAATFVMPDNDLSPIKVLIPTLNATFVLMPVRV